jgi:hypothetical protein
MKKPPTSEEFKESVEAVRQLIGETLEVNKIDVATSIASCMKVVIYLLIRVEVPIYLVENLRKSFGEACKEIGVEYREKPS